GSARVDIGAGSFGGRGVIWKAGLQQAQEHPLRGVGAGAFPAAIAPTLGHRWSAHETFLTVLVEEGIIGIVLLLAIAVGAAKRLQQVPAVQRRLWIVILSALAVGSLSTSLD